jgi:hypothetical protein
MDLILFILIMAVLWYFFYRKFSILPAARLRTFPGLRNLNGMTREYLLEIAHCAVAGIAAILIASIAVWYVTLFQ